MIKCPICGKNLPDDANFCNNCGNSTRQVYSSNQETTNEKEIVQHPERYQKQSFPYAHRCRNGHLIPAFTPIITANNNRYCPYCGERLSIA
ncbi:MAG: zinc ribbon domain-containing protein [Candidatus Bathyarchaeia archaeon]|jgi:rRNA maturation endonuclease Nob1